MRALSVLLLLVTSLAVVKAQGAPRIHIDTVLLARDLDGDGKEDYVVRESKRTGSTPATEDQPASRRLAVYLDARPGAATTAWSTRWDTFNEIETILRKVVPLDGSATFLAIISAGADYDGTNILLVEHHRVRNLVTHGIDYGDGDFDIRREHDQVVIDATQPHLTLDKTPVPRSATCRTSQRLSVHLVYDPARQQFRVDSQRCVPRGVA